MSNIKRKIKILFVVFSLLIPVLYLPTQIQAKTTYLFGDKNDGLTDKQKNSLALLNYLTVVNQEINASSNSRIFLEEVYNTLINDPYPNAVDKLTQNQLDYMLDTIQQYRMIDVKRERLQYIYEQNQAQAIRDAVPDPRSVLNVVLSMDWKKMIASVVYMAIDSKTSYDSSMAKAEMKYLQDGWKLDDEASEALHRSRTQMFDYMLNVVRDNNIPGEYALNENQVNEFVKWKNNTNITRRIHYLESGKNTYEFFGGYWLLLADSYYQNENYDKCIEAIKNYENLGLHIFRKDYDYANTLPQVVYSLMQTGGNNSYSSIRSYLEAILNNIDNNDWNLRYFVIQTYLYLYSKTNNKDDLKKAYLAAYNNVNHLVTKQIELNNEYLNDIKTVEVPSGATKKESKEIKNINKLLQEKRKTELPPVYEPLYLNCEILFQLADALNISNREKKDIEKILYGNDSTLFLTRQLNNMFRFSDSSDLSTDNVIYDKGIISIPTELVSDKSIITVTVKRGSETVTFDDWEVEKVDRKKKDFSSFSTTYKSSKSKKYKYQKGDIIEINVIPVEDSNSGVVNCQFETIVKKVLKIFEKTEFIRK